MFHHQHYVFGDQTVQVPVHLNFGKYILDRLRTRKYEIAFENIDTKAKLSYKDLTQHAVNLAVSLTKLGVRKGDIVAIGLEKRNEFFPTALAIVFTGATYTPYDIINNGRATLKHKINITEPKYFICSRKFLDKYEELLKEYDCIKMILTIDDAVRGIMSVKDLTKEDIDVELFEPAAVSGQTDPMLILFSSGTTGLSKGVQLTHLNCICKIMTDDIIDDSLKAVFISGKWCHSYDIITTFKFLASGKKILYSEDFNCESILRSIDEYQANIIFLASSDVSLLSMEGDLSKYNLESIRIIFSVGGPIHQNTIDKVKKMFPNSLNILNGYGMTEVGYITNESWANKGPKPGSVGKAVPGINLKVGSPITQVLDRCNARGTKDRPKKEIHIKRDITKQSVVFTVSDLETHKTLGPNERGEICLKSPTLMKGYIGMDPSSYMDEEGFFRTGDLGHYDKDKYFYIDGRLKEMIKYRGHSVTPLELETLLQLHPGVREAGVVGKPVPVYGQIPVAFVVKQPGSTVTEQELVDYIAVEVGPFMQLRGGVKFIEEMPRNSMEKILKNKLKDLLGETKGN